MLSPPLSIIIKSRSSSGIKEIKKLLDRKDSEISYLGSSKFSITVKSKEYKSANLEMEKIIGEIKSKAKSLKMIFEVKSWSLENILKRGKLNIL